MYLTDLLRCRLRGTHGVLYPLLLEMFLKENHQSKDLLNVKVNITSLACIKRKSNLFATEDDLGLAYLSLIKWLRLSIGICSHLIT